MRNLYDPILREVNNLNDSSNRFNRYETYDKTKDYSYLLEFLDSKNWTDIEHLFCKKKKIMRQSRDYYFPICFPGMYDKTYSNSNFSEQ